MTKKTVALLFGGVSSEHEVSCKSAASVIENIDREKYDVIMLGITKSGDWFQYRGPVDTLKKCEWERSEYIVPAFISPSRSTHGILYEHLGRFESRHIDVVYPVLHGRNGEDGTMQGLLDIAGIPYVGSGVLASADCMDKAVCHTLLSAAGVPQVEWLEYHCGCDSAAAAKEIEEKLGWPVFVKPANAGSSVGITKVKTAGAVAEAFALAFESDEKIIVEAAVIDPIEIECAVLGNDECVVGGPGEIVPADEFYTYDAKYYNDKSETILKARISEEKAAEVREMAVRAYKALGCRGLARVDFLVERATGKVVLNEPNTLPGFTNISMYPKLMIDYGFSYAELIDRLLTLALEK